MSSRFNRISIYALNKKDPDAIRCSSRPAILAMTTLCMARTTRLWTVGSWTRPV